MFCTNDKIDSAVFCTISKEECAVSISEDFINSDIDDKYKFLHSKVLSWISEIKDDLPKVICLPFDSTEAWIVAAFDGDIFDLPIEQIEKPGDTIIARRAKYHENRVSREGQNKLKKSERFYKTTLIPKLLAQWSNVKVICSTAKRFEDDIINIFTQRGNQVL